MHSCKVHTHQNGSGQGCVCRTEKSKSTIGAKDWIELSDWIPLLLTGKQGMHYRNQCASAHKALYNSKFGGLPSQEFFLAFDAYAAEVYEQYTQKPSSSSTAVGLLDPKLASLLQLPRSLF